MAVTTSLCRTAFWTVTADARPRLHQKDKRHDRGQHDRDGDEDHPEPLRLRDQAHQRGAKEKARETDHPGARDRQRTLVGTDELAQDRVGRRNGYSDAQPQQADTQDGNGGRWGKGDDGGAQQAPVQDAQHVVRPVPVQGRVDYREAVAEGGGPRSSKTVKT